MDGWNSSFLLGWPIFRCYVSFREGTGTITIIQRSEIPVNKMRKSADVNDLLRTYINARHDHKFGNAAKLILVFIGRKEEKQPIAPTITMLLVGDH